MAIYTGAILQTGKPTPNGHVYSRECIESALAEFQKKIETEGVYGILGVRDDIGTNLSEISHKVKGVSLSDDGVLEGTIETMDTNNGRVVDSFYNDCELKSVGLGEVDWGGNVSDFQLVSVDVNRKNKEGDDSGTLKKVIGYTERGPKKPVYIKDNIVIRAFMDFTRALCHRIASIKITKG